MEQQFILKDGDKTIRFTPDGKVAVKDAMEALCDSDRITALWDKIVSENPEILEYCDQYSFQNDKNILVANSRGWERIISLMLERISNTEFAPEYDND